MAHRSQAFAALLMLALAGCASGSPVELGRDADARAARARLVEAAKEGPVRLDVNALPRVTGGTLGEAEIAAQAAHGVRGLNVRFALTAEATGTARLALLFDPPPGFGPAQACEGAALPAPVPEAGPLRLQAVFCDGRTHVADASAATPDRSEAGAQRLIWRTTGRLFPDDYAETYGFNLFGYRVGLSGQFGF
jgi:hypothetical protein